MTEWSPFCKRGIGTRRYKCLRVEARSEGDNMTKRNLLLQTCAATAIVLGGLATPAFAQSEPGATEEAVGEILVTARKRVENLEDVPIAISVLGAGAIERKNIDGPGDVANQTPGLTFDVGLVPSDTRISIRGLQATRGRPNVAILVDGIDTSSENFGVAGGGIIANLRIVDVERIEVVKGPQTVLYGRSAFAGAINYVSKRPGDAFEGSLSGMGGRFGTYEIKGAVGGPIGGGWGARINAGYHHTDGDYTNPVTGGRLNAAETYGGALGLEYKGEGFKAYARVQYSKEKYSERATVLLRAVDPTSGAVRTQDGGVLLRSLRCPPPAGSISSPATCTVPASNPSLYSITGDISQSATYRAGEAGIDISGDPNNGGRAYTGTEVETWRATLELTKDFGDSWELTSLTGYTDNSGWFNEDFDHTNYRLQANTPIPVYSAGGNFSTLNVFRTQFGWPLPFLPAYGLQAEFDTRTSTKQFNQELRLAYKSDRLNVLLDALYWNERSVYRDSSLFWLRDGANQTLAQFISASQGATPTFGPMGPTFFHLLSPPVTSPNPQRITRNTDSFSFAASFEYKLSDQFTASLEGRVIHDRIKYTGFNFDPTPVNTYGVRNAQNQPTVLTQNTVSFTKFNPRVSLSWNNGNGVLLFANWAQGTKPGGVDTTDQNGNVTDGVFKPEKVDAFEVGGKFVTDNGRLVFNASFFYSIYKDQQIGVIDNSGPVAQSRTDNIGKSRSYGIEAEINWSPVDQLFLRAAYTYTNSKYTDYIPPRCSNVDAADTQSGNCNFNGHMLPFTPEHQLNLSARFEQPVGDNGKLWFEADGRILSRRFMSASNLFWLPAYEQVDLRAGYDFGQFSLEAFVENVFNNKAPRSGTSTVDYGYFDLNSFNLPRGVLASLSPRPTWGIKAGVKF
jgi:iron complex outermembrane recepter protein